MSTECVILAAGSSSRCKMNKLMLELDGQTVIERCINAFYPECERIIVVTGFFLGGICEILMAYDRVEMVHNKFYEMGMFSSIKVGISEVKGDRFFLTPGDYPLLKTHTVSALKNTIGDFIVPKFNGISGHPILLSKNLIPQILYSNDISLRECLSGIPFISKDVNDMGVITDIDTMDDYNKIRMTL